MPRFTSCSCNLLQIHFLEISASSFTNSAVLSSFQTVRLIAAVNYSKVLSVDWIEYFIAAVAILIWLNLISSDS